MFIRSSSNKKHVRRSALPAASAAPHTASCHKKTSKGRQSRAPAACHNYPWRHQGAALGDEECLSQLTHATLKEFQVPLQNFSAPLNHLWTATSTQRAS